MVCGLPGDPKWNPSTWEKYPNLPTMIRRKADERPNYPAQRYKRDGVWRDLTRRELVEKFSKLACGLMSLGLEKGQRAAVFADTCPEWWWSDLAILSCGGVVATIYQSLLPDEVRYIAEHSQTRYLFVEDCLLLEKVLKVRDQLPDLQKIIVMRELYEDDDPNVIDLSTLEKLGEQALAKDPGMFERRVQQTGPEDLATIIYTSGTTGPPKGVMLSHGNIVFVCWSMSVIFPEIEDGDVHLAHLPLAHAYERCGGHYAVHFNDGIIAYFNGLEHLLTDIAETKPKILLSVPRLFEKIYSVVLMQLEQGPKWKRRMFESGLALGDTIGGLERSGKKVPLLLGLRYNAYRRLIFGKITSKFGGNLKYLVSASAPISKEILRFFAAIGMMPLEGWGMTECAAPGTINRVEHAKIGTVGPSLPGVEIDIADDGEIRVRGPNVLVGYYRDDGNTAALLKDGWLYTGDIGMIDEDGFLTITDRKKDMIITAGGKNIAPQNIENHFKLDPFISEIMVYGDRKKFLTAIITLDPERLPTWAAEQGVQFDDFADLVGKPEVTELVREIFAERNRVLPRYEQLKLFTILPKQFTREDEDLTPTLKLKKKVIVEKYGHLIEQLYEGLEDGKI
jgi:long-chain acyl-CoA synthetase